MSKRKADHLVGGHVQRAKWASDGGSSGAARSSLAEYLLERWSWGLMPAAEVQRVAHRAVQDGLAQHQIVRLSSIGTSGVHPNRCHHDLSALLGDEHISNALWRLNVAYKVPGFFGRILNLDHHVLLPHQVFAEIHNNFPSSFCNHILGGTTANIEKFWSDVAGHPGLAGHPIHTLRDKSKVVPIALHGDGLAVSGCGRSWAKSVDVYSWSSMLASGETAATNYMIYLMYPNLITNESLAAFWKVLCWSLYWLFVGKWPTRDPDGHAWPAGSDNARKAGQPLAGGYRATLFCLRADLEHLSKAFGLQHSGSAQPCCLCKANMSTLPWTDHTRGALWRGSICNNTTWLAEHPDAHRLFTAVPGFGITMFVPDVMHTFHLGVYQYVFGSILKYLTWYHMPGTRDENLASVWGMIKDGYQDLTIDIAQL